MTEIRRSLDSPDEIRVPRARSVSLVSVDMRRRGVTSTWFKGPVLEIIDQLGLKMRDVSVIEVDRYGKVHLVGNAVSIEPKEADNERTGRIPEDSG